MLKNESKGKNKIHLMSFRENRVREFIKFRN